VPATEVAAFESKRYTASDSGAKAAFKKHTLAEKHPGKFYPLGTRVLVGEEKRRVLQQAFPEYSFQSVLRVPDGGGGALRLSESNSMVLEKKVKDLKPGETFTMQGPMGRWADGRALSIKVSRGADGTFTVALVPVDV
jgi:hypothetical protein